MELKWIDAGTRSGADSEGVSDREIEAKPNLYDIREVYLVTKFS